MVNGSLDIGLYLYLRCESEFYDAVNDLRQTNNNGYIKFERCTVANSTKGGGTWVETKYEPLITYPTESPETKFYRGDKTFAEVVIGSGGYAAHLYATTINSDISGYKKASYEVESTETEISTTLSNSTALVEEYLFDNHIGITTIQNGVWRFMCYCKIGAVNPQGAKIRFEVFLRHVDNSETVLFTKDSSVFTNTDYLSEIIPIEYSGTVYSCVTTDRLGYKVYVITTSVSSLTATYIVGDGRGLYMDTPLSLGHDQLRRFNIDRKYQHLDSETILSDDIDETNDKIGFWDHSILKFILVSFTTLKTYFGEIFQAKNLKFTDTSASSWVADTNYSGYGYKCELTLSGVTTTDVAEVTYAHAEAITGNYSPVCLTATDKVTIYSKVNTTITIPTILINKQS